MKDLSQVCFDRCLSLMFPIEHSMFYVKHFTAVSMDVVDCLRMHNSFLITACSVVTVLGNSLHVIQKREYDQEIPQSQTADKPMAPRGCATQISRETRKQTKQSNQLSPPHQDDCETRMDIK